MSWLCYFVVGLGQGWPFKECSQAFFALAGGRSRSEETFRHPERAATRSSRRIIRAGLRLAYLRPPALAVCDLTQMEEQP